VVSDETRPGALEINETRKKNGLKTLEIISIPLVLADDQKPISSTRIKKGEIDKEGRILADG
jgi:pantetheine-phosphate adenylyltransferase